MGLGLLMYAQDYDETFPWTRTNLVNPNKAWPEMIYPYVKSSQIFVCPSATVPVFDALSYSNAFYFSTYGMNQDTFLLNQGVKLAAIVKPTILVTVADSERTNPTGNPALLMDFRTNYTSRHLEGANFGFADGHAKWFKTEKIWDTTGVNPTQIARVGKYWQLGYNAIGSE
jgi:prepilin-type processing-associated H-X9-DG protein